MSNRPTSSGTNRKSNRPTFKAIAVDDHHNPIKPKKKPSTRPKVKRYEYRVIYQREGWEQAQSRFYQTERGAQGFVRFLWQNDGWTYAPLTKVLIQRRQVGEWVANRGKS